MIFSEIQLFLQSNVGVWEMGNNPAPKFVKFSMGFYDDTLW